MPADHERSRTPRKTTPKSKTPKSKTPRSKTPRSRTPRSKTPRTTSPRSSTSRSSPSRSSRKKRKREKRRKRDKKQDKGMTTLMLLGYTVLCVVLTLLVVSAIFLIVMLILGKDPLVFLGITDGGPQAGLNNTLESLNNTLEGLNSTLAVLTTTIAYPSMPSIERVPIRELPPSTYSPISSTLQMYIRTNHFLIRVRTNVIYELIVISPTQTIELHCDGLFIRDIFMRTSKSERMELSNYTVTDKILAVHLPNEVLQGTFTVEISYVPSEKAFEDMSFPCDGKKCSVSVNRQVDLLVPHFYKPFKREWTVRVEHPEDVIVLMNSRKDQGASTLTRFSAVSSFKTSPLLTSELSIAIIQNLVKHDSGSQVETYLSSGIKQIGDLPSILQTALESKSRPSPPTDELFIIIVVPVVENYNFFGRNLAVIGKDMLAADMESKLNFVWTWVYRMIIYKKVVSASQPWMYDISALFLSTLTKSNKKDMWRKHLYELAIDSDHTDETGDFNVAAVYKDEYRYYEKPQNVAKISTLLSMLTSFGSTISGDPLTILDSVQDSVASDNFPFINKKLEIQNGNEEDVDNFMDCYNSVPDIPHVHLDRIDDSQVAVQRTTGSPGYRCNIHLSLVDGTNKQQILLGAGVEKVTMRASTPLLLSGEAPFPAHGYSISQADFDKLLYWNVMQSYDSETAKLLTVNVFRAAADGRLTYDSLKTFVDMMLRQKYLTVDEVVDLWIWTISKSRDDMLTNLTYPIVEHSLKATGSAAINVADYICKRFEQSVQEDPLFMIEKTKLLVKNCGKECWAQMTGNHAELNDRGVYENRSPFNHHILEIYLCSNILLGAYDFRTFAWYLEQCKERPCFWPLLRGLLCTKDIDKLENFFKQIMTLDINVMANRHAVRNIFNGLASNTVSQHLLVPYLMDNWHTMFLKLQNVPSLLGEIITAAGSTINTESQLNDFKNFVAYHGESLDMFREFKEETIKAEKALAWKNKFSKTVSELFGQ